MVGKGQVIIERVKQINYLRAILDSVINGISQPNKEETELCPAIDTHLLVTEASGTGGNFIQGSKKFLSRTCVEDI
jgi:hypothetical protein